MISHISRKIIEKIKKVQKMTFLKNFKQIKKYNFFMQNRKEHAKNSGKNDFHQILANFDEKK
jgi:hypothetical protein